MGPEKDDGPRGKVVFEACRIGTVLLIAYITGSASKNSSLRDQKYLKSEGEWDDCCCEGDRGVEAPMSSPHITVELPPKSTELISNLNCESRRVEAFAAFSRKQVFRYLDDEIVPGDWHGHMPRLDASVGVFVHREQLRNPDLATRTNYRYDFRE